MLYSLYLIFLFIRFCTIWNTTKELTSETLLFAVTLFTFTTTPYFFVRTQTLSMAEFSIQQSSDHYNFLVLKKHGLEHFLVHQIGKDQGLSSYWATFASQLALLLHHTVHTTLETSVKEQLIRARRTDISSCTFHKSCEKTTWSKSTHSIDSTDFLMQFQYDVIVTF